jgi:gas vesicle protein
MSDKATSRMLGAALAGGIIGAGAALLFAPRSGKETREHMQENFNDLKHKARREASPVLSAWEEEV